MGLVAAMCSSVNAVSCVGILNVKLSIFSVGVGLHRDGPHFLSDAVLWPSQRGRLGSLRIEPLPRCWNSQAWLSKPGDFKCLRVLFTSDRKWSKRWTGGDGDTCRTVLGAAPVCYCAVVAKPLGKAFSIYRSV